MHYKIVCNFMLWLSALISLSLQDHDVFYPLIKDKDNELATKIYCRTNESRHFKYNSVIDMWNDVKGQILLDADIELYCLGNDNEGIFGPEALKYKARILNLNIEEKHRNFPSETLIRRKRGIGDFFSNAWTSIKNFFVNLFWGSPTEDSSPDPGVIEERNYPEETTTTTTTATTPAAEEHEEDIDFNSVEYRDLYSVPFEFYQLANGSIPEVRFATRDTDARVKNFKRHLVDAFATHLNLKPKHNVVENTVLGEHRSAYNITLGGMASAFTSEGGRDQDSEYPALDDEQSRTIVITKVVRENDILKLAPANNSDAINNKDDMELEALQTQIFKNGNLLSTSGTSHLVLFTKSAKKYRGKRSIEEEKDNENVLNYFQVHTRYDLQLQRRVKRSINDNAFEEETIRDTYVSGGRNAETENAFSRQRIRDYQLSIPNKAQIIRNLLENKSGNDREQIQTVFEMVDQEVRYSLDMEPESLSHEIRHYLTKNFLSELCSVKFRRCFDMMQLLARAGGKEAEEVILSFITEGDMNLQQRREIADLLSDIPHPSAIIINNLNDLMKSSLLHSDLLGSIALTASNMAAKSKDFDTGMLSKSMSILLEQSFSSTETVARPLTIDLLEALGNIGDEDYIDQILLIFHKSTEKLDIQIACVHALRHLVSTDIVKNWMLKALVDGPCDVTHAIVGSLLDELYKQEMSGDFELWPRNGINDVDVLLSTKLKAMAPEFRCAAAAVARYFGRKRFTDFNGTESFFEPDSEPFQSDVLSRHKRDVWDNLDCGEWNEDTKYAPIQERDEFLLDKQTYNRRKSCLATKMLGVTGANSEIYAGMFAGVKEPSNPPKYKLFTKFVSAVNFLGHEMEIGSFYFYHHSGETKAFVRIMGRTRQEFRNSDCTPTELRYHPITHIPLYSVQISVIQFSLGIHLSSQMTIDTQCPNEKNYDLKPQSLVRAGGEAYGTVLFARGGINLGGNFNYHLKFLFSPTPDMCLSGQHGYDPMSISMESYYQLWNPRRFRWGRPRIWAPSMLKWNIGFGRRHPWFNDTCILRGVTSTSQNEVTSPSQITDSENDLFVVRA